MFGFDGGNVAETLVEDCREVLPQGFDFALNAEFLIAALDGEVAVVEGFDVFLDHLNAAIAV